MLWGADAEALPAAGADHLADHAHQLGRHHVQQTYEHGHAILG
jgi:hypothetical protein